MTIDYPLAPPRSMAQLRAEAAGLRSLPVFDRVLHEYTRALLRYRAAVRPLAKLVANEDRYRTLNFLFTVWAEKVAAGGSGAMTYGELFEICRRGEVSPRLLKTTLALATFTGFLRREPNPADRRSRLYTPTPLMLDFPLHWLMPAAEALDQLLPASRRAGPLQRDRGALVHFLRSAGREFASGVQPMTEQPEFMSLFGQKEGGAVLCMGLLVAEFDAEPQPSRLELSERFALSKSQVAQLIAMGRDLGLLAVEAGASHPTDRLREDHAEWVALSLAFLSPHMPSDSAAD